MQSEQSPPCNIEEVRNGVELRYRRKISKIQLPTLPEGCKFDAENLASEEQDDSNMPVEDSFKNGGLRLQMDRLKSVAEQIGGDGFSLSDSRSKNSNKQGNGKLPQHSENECFTWPVSTGGNEKKSIRSGFWRFFWFELTRGYALENDEARYSEKRKKVYAFIKIPKELEKFLFYGYLQCLDAFLYVFTFLPLRFFMALLHFCVGLFSLLGRRKIRRRFRATPGESCDVLKVIIILIASFLMTFIDTSVLYHVVRGQAVIKLYIFFNMLEVADKLFSSFGQDILDALFWTATEPGSRKHNNSNYLGTIPHLLLAVLYVWLHTVLVLLQATTLNVAFNSHSKALLTIMMSNNFVELKGNVFKKFAKNNLFQMACSDVRERFHYFVLLSVVVIRNMTAVQWQSEHFLEMVPDLLLVVGGEILVDWIKHAFITKFNDIPFEVYKDFTTTIAYDMAKSRDTAAFSDHSDQVARRMGFIPLPLSVLVIRILTQSFPFYGWSFGLLWIMTFVAVLLFKIFNSIFVLGKASRYIRQYEELLSKADLLKRLGKKRSKSVPSSPKLGLIEFSDVMQQSHPAVGAMLTVSDLLHQQYEEFYTRESLKLQRRSKSVTYLADVQPSNESTTIAAEGGVGGKENAAALPSGSADAGVSVNRVERLLNSQAAADDGGGELASTAAYLDSFTSSPGDDEAFAAKFSSSATATPPSRRVKQNPMTSLLETRDVTEAMALLVAETLLTSSPSSSEKTPDVVETPIAALKTHDRPEAAATNIMTSRMMTSSLPTLATAFSRSTSQNAAAASSNDSSPQAASSTLPSSTLPSSSQATLAMSTNPASKDMQALLDVDRYTLVNGDRIEP